LKINAKQFGYLLLKILVILCWMGSKADILNRLRRDILMLQGSKPPAYVTETDMKLGPVIHAFPNSTFPVAAVHEFICKGQAAIAPTMGFVNALLSALSNHRPVIWITRKRRVYPPALTSFGIIPEQLVFIEAKKDKDLLWTMEEALRCSALSAVVCEAKEVSFIASRRLQLAVEESRVTGFILRNDPVNLATACDVRWKISSATSEKSDDLPGMGHPRWDIELLKVRNGKTGAWEATWKEDRFQFEQKVFQLLHHRKTATG
jgi:protein ImuA